MKRSFDIAAAFFGLFFLSPLFCIVACLIKWDSRGSAFFRQERIGRNFTPFYIFKFRTMFQNTEEEGRAITAGEDPRITRIGHFLRKTKIDELPQLINVVRGEMSLVGPRPEVRKYVEIFRTDYEEILQLRPGITDLASVKHRHEATTLGKFEDPEERYIKEILPDKIRLAKIYCRQNSFIKDLKIIFETFLEVAQC